MIDTSRAWRALLRPHVSAALVLLALPACGLLDEEPAFPALSQIERGLASEGITTAAIELVLSGEGSSRGVSLHAHGEIEGDALSPDERQYLAGLFLLPLLSGRFTFAYDRGALIVTSDAGGVMKLEWRTPGFPHRVTCYECGVERLVVERERAGVNEHVLRIAASVGSRDVLVTRVRLDP